MKPFQAILLAVFGMLALLAIFLFATFSGSGNSQVGTVTVWGSLSENVFDEVVSATNLASNNDLKDVRYVYVPEGSFEQSLVEAIAAGRGPDMVLLPASLLVGLKDTLEVIPYRTISRRDFQDTFIEAGEVFLSQNGVYGIPFSVDPFVLYWNRSLFSANGIARAPKYWDEFVDIAPRLTKATASGTLTQSAVALGEWNNVTGAKEILISLITGLGNDIVIENQDGTYSARLAAKDSEGIVPAESALRYYSEFADPTSPVYSWNKSQAPSRDAFIGGLLAVYLAPASEARAIRASNPNLNFDIAAYPAVRDGRVAVPGTVYAFSIPRGSQNANGALEAAFALSGTVGQETLLAETGLPSVRRDALSVATEDPYQSLFRDAALNTFVFLDPDIAETEGILRRMVENVSSGRFRIAEAVRSAQAELEALLERVQ